MLHQLDHTSKRDEAGITQRLRLPSRRALSNAQLAGLGAGFGFGAGDGAGAGDGEAGFS
jgi:hypothetical protein